MDNHFSQSIYAESRQTSVFSVIFIPFLRPILKTDKVEIEKFVHIPSKKFVCVIL